VPDEVTNGAASEFNTDNERRYGLFDPESARQRGYRPIARQSGGRPGQAFAKDWTESELFILAGREHPGFENVETMPTDNAGKALPDGGCLSEAVTILTSGTRISPMRRTTLIEGLGHESYQRAEKDSRVRAAVEAWAGCMRKVGYSYASIWEPNDTRWPDPVGEQEIATATADVACKLQTNLVGIWFAVESAYQERLIEQHELELTAARDYVRDVNRNAARVLAAR
jgi:hypothetical protein